MAKKFDDLINSMSPEAQQLIQDKTNQHLEEMILKEIREARNLSQENMADLLNVKQAAISKMERRTDMYLSTLKKVIEAMGGELELIAKFPECSIKINQNTNLDESSTNC